MQLQLVILNAMCTGAKPDAPAKKESPKTATKKASPQKAAKPAPAKKAAKSPANSPAAPSGCGAELLGQRIRVFWPMDNAWYAGSIKEYDGKAKHLGQCELGACTWC